MGLETIISLIESETEEEIAKIRQKAEEKCNEIRDAARIRVQSSRDRILLEGERNVLRAERKVLLQAEYDEMKTLRDARWQGIRGVFVAAEEKLADIPSTPGYSGILRSLIIEGREIVGGGEIVILCRSVDEDAVEDATESFEGVAIRSLPLHDPQIQSGGVIVTSEHTPIRCDQTFATRLDQMRDSLTQQVSGILYGGEGDGY